MPTVSTPISLELGSRHPYSHILLPLSNSFSQILLTIPFAKFLDRKVFLSLHVRVDEDWRASTESLTRYGYVESDFG